MTPQCGLVEAGSTVEFSLAADTNNMIASVSGCGGTLNQSTYITARAQADCVFSVEFTEDLVSLDCIPGNPNYTELNVQGVRNALSLFIVKEVPDNENAFCRIFWFALAGVALSSIYLEWMPVLIRIFFGLMLGGLTGLAFSASRNGAVIGASIGGVVGIVVFLLGFFIPGRPVIWNHLWVLPFYLFLGLSSGSITGAIIGCMTKERRMK